MERRAIRPPPVVRGWSQALRYSLKRIRIRYVEDELTRLAGFLALIGPIEEHKEVFHAIMPLFVHADRLRQWNPALATIPHTAESVERIAACCLAYSRTEGEGWGRVRVRLEKVVPVMVQVVDPELLVKDATEGGLTHPGTIFHPNTWKVVRARYKGKFGDLADPEFTKAAIKKVKTINVP